MRTGSLRHGSPCGGWLRPQTVYRRAMTRLLIGFAAQLIMAAFVRLSVVNVGRMLKGPGLSAAADALRRYAGVRASRAA